LINHKCLLRNSLRTKKPLIKISCAALPETLIEAELFGYEKGAFTDAQARKRVVLNWENPRAEIDAIDNKLLRLLNKRAAIALRVGEAKRRIDTSLCDPSREQEVLTRLSAENL
jgi:transcriptional regulator of acetoin/glycerol metabolism